MGHQTIPDTVSVPLSHGTWLSVLHALRSHRYELQRYLARKTETPAHVREATRLQLRDVNAAIDKITDTVQFD